MKKFASVLIAMSLMMGVATVSFAADDAKKMEKPAKTPKPAKTKKKKM